MDKLKFLLSKKILILLCGVVFAGVTFASSGAESLIKNSAIITPESKIPEVEKIAEPESSPSPGTTVQQTLPPPKNNPVPAKNTPIIKTTELKPVAVATQNPTPKPSTAASLPLPLQSPAITPKPSINTSSSTITGLRQNIPENQDKEDEKDEDYDTDRTGLNRAFQDAEDD